MYSKALGREVTDQQIDFAAKKRGWSREKTMQAIQYLDANPNLVTDYRESIKPKEPHPALSGVAKSGIETALGLGRLITNPVETLQPLAKGIIGAGDAVVGYPAEVANIALPKDRQIPLPRNAQGDQYETGRMVGDVATFMGLGGPAGKALKYGAKVLPELAPALTSQKFWPGLARRAAGAGLYEASKMPAEDETRPGNFNVGAGLSALVDTAFGAAKFPIHAGVAFANKHAIPQIEEAIEAAKGLKVPLGDILQSPTLKKIYDLAINKVFGSGTEATGQQLKKQLEDEASAIWKGYGKEVSPSKVELQLNKELLNRYGNIKAEKNRRYNAVQEIANEEGYTVNTDEFAKDLRRLVKTNTAKDLFSHINSDYRDVKNYLEFLSKEPKTNAQLLSESGALNQRIKQLQKKADKNKSIGAEITKASQKYGIPSEILEEKIYGKVKSVITPKEEYELLGSKKLQRVLNKDLTKDIRSQKDLERGLERFEEPNPEPLSYTEGNRVKKALYDAERRLSAFPIWEREVPTGTYQRLADAMHRNMQRDIASKASPLLQEEEALADKYYKEKIVPFKNEVIGPYISGNKPYIGEGGREMRTARDPGGIVQDFIQTGTASDKIYKLKTALDAMSPREKELFKAAYLKRAIDRKGNINPAKLRTHIGENKLTPAQYEMLFDIGERKQLEDFGERAKLGKEALEHMLIPKTGYSATQAAILGGSIASSLGLGKYAHSKTQENTDSEFLSWLSGIAATAAIPLVARGGNKAFTSEKIRKEILDRLKGIEVSEPVRRFAKALAEAYGNKKENLEEKNKMHLYLTKNIGER